MRDCYAKSTQVIRMPTIEQVSKRLRSDRNWFTKCLMGVLFCCIPILHFFACGYLYRMFRAGKAQKAFALPEWGDWKGLFIDGLKFFLIAFIFGLIPIALMTFAKLAIGWSTGSYFAHIPVAPAFFIAGPLTCSALYLYMLDEDFSNCFNIQALTGLLKRTVEEFWVPTLALLGLSLLLPFAFFFGAVIYFYSMGYVFKNFEQSTDKR